MWGVIFGMSGFGDHGNSGGGNFGGHDNSGGGNFGGHDNSGDGGWSGWWVGLVVSVGGQFNSSGVGVRLKPQECLNLIAFLGFVLGVWAWVSRSHGRAFWFCRFWFVAL